MQLCVLGFSFLRKTDVSPEEFWHLLAHKALYPVEKVVFDNVEEKDHLQPQKLGHELLVHLRLSIALDQVEDQIDV